jgi:hypothetical protein
MKRIVITAACAIALSLLFSTSAYAWVYIDPGTTGLDINSLTDTIYDIDRRISKNFKNYPSAFALANLGGYPIGDAYIGNFPHMFFGISGTVGCSNMKYWDEDVPRETSVYPAYAPNPNIYLGFGLGKGVDIMFKIMAFSDAMWRPPMNEKSAKLDKFNVYSGGGKLRYNVIEKKTLLPFIFGFGGFTVSAGADFMDGIMTINGNYKYTIAGVDVPNPPAPVAGKYPLTLDSYYNFSMKYSMLSWNAQAMVYFNFLWLFDFYTGFGLSMTWGYCSLDASGVALVSNPALGNLGMVLAVARYKKFAPGFMGIYIAGLEINIWVLKITAETMVNISNGKDISLALGTRFQF